MVEIVQLRPALGCDDIVQGLRTIADDIEAGAYDFAPTQVVVVMGRETEHRDREGISSSYQWQTRGLGKTSVFAGKGLLAAALSSFEGVGG